MWRGTARLTVSCPSWHNNPTFGIGVCTEWHKRYNRVPCVCVCVRVRVRVSRPMCNKNVCVPLQAKGVVCIAEWERPLKRE